MTLRSSLFAFASVSLLLAAGCASHDGAAADDASQSGDALSGATVEHVRIVAVDFRKCAFPMCGGVFVSRVNFAQTKCADGTWQDSCYVSEVDFAKLALPPAQASKLSDEARAGRVVIKGKLASKSYGKNVSGFVFAATEAWGEENQSAPSGTFYQVTDSGIVCITSPCPTIHEDKLNSSTNKNVTGLDLSGAGLNSKQIGGVFAALDQGGVIVAGDNAVVKNAGPAGNGTNLVATAVYTNVIAEPGFCQNDSECVMTNDAAPVASKADCYCTACPQATDVTTAGVNEASYGKYCSKSHGNCPQVKCAAREARCVENTCTAVVPPL